MFWRWCFMCILLIRFQVFYIHIKDVLLHKSCPSMWKSKDKKGSCKLSGAKNKNVLWTNRKAFKKMDAESKRCLLIHCLVFWTVWRIRSYFLIWLFHKKKLFWMSTFPGISTSRSFQAWRAFLFQWAKWPNSLFWHASLSPVLKNTYLNVRIVALRWLWYERLDFYGLT